MKLSPPHKFSHRVVKIVANVKQFRSSLYPALQDALAAHGVELLVLYSDPDAIEKNKLDSIDLPVPLGKKVPRIYLLRNRLLLQFPPIKELATADLIIVVQASGYLLNYLLLFLGRLGLMKIAYWGHGFNRQGCPRSLSERIKRIIANWSHWWFAYTKPTADYLVSIGVKSSKITSIENAIDTQAFRNTLKSINDAEIEAMKQKLGIRPNDTVGLYCGSLYPEKRISYLIEATEQISKCLPSFRLLIIGGGSESDVVRSASMSNEAIVYTGAMFGRDKAVCFRIAETFLNPGLVGLGILDAFAAGLPFLTTSEALHSPEIDYLADRLNGLMISGGADQFAEAVISLLRDPVRRESLRQGALESSEHYTLENMVSNVTQGILSSLSISPSNYLNHE